MSRALGWHRKFSRNADASTLWGPYVMLVFGVGGPVAQGLGHATVHYKSRQLKKPKFMPRPIGTNNKQSMCNIPCHHMKSSREAASRWATRGTTKLFNGRAYGELGRRELARGFDAPYA